MKSLIVLALALVGSFSAEARKMDFKNATLATGLRGTWGPSTLGDKAYADSSGAQTVFDKKVETNFSGDYFVSLGFGKVTLRLGAELLIPRTLSELKGTNAAGTEYFEVKSSIYSLVPELNIEVALLQSQSTKVFVGVGGGYGFTTLENTYTFTTAGVTQYGIGDYIELSQSSDPLYQAFIGFETMMVDNVTFSLDAGYRYMIVRNLKYKTAQRGLDGRDHAVGDAVVNNDNTTRVLNLSGGFVGLSFRFYIL